MEAVFADIVKKSNPVVVVQPSDRTQNSAAMDEIRETINPSRAPLCSTRNEANGGVIRECPSIETTATIMSDVVSRLGNNHVTAPQNQSIWYRREFT